MKNFFKLILLLLMIGMAMILMWSPGIRNEERFTGLISLFGLVIMFRLGMLSLRKKSQ